MERFSLLQIVKRNRLRLFMMLLPATLAGCSCYSLTNEQTKTVDLSQSKTTHFVSGMRGAENIYIARNPLSVYVTDLSGMLYLLQNTPQERTDPDSGERAFQTLSITRKIKLGNSAWGITEGRDGYLYVAASDNDVDEVAEKGGRVYRVDKALTTFEPISGIIDGVNGLASNEKGDLYLATGNLSLLFPRGKLLRFPYDPLNSRYAEQEVFIDNLGSANGLTYSRKNDTLTLTETFSSVSEIGLKDESLTTILETSKIVDGFDDVCIDRNERLWLAEPVNGFIKMFDPKQKSLIRYQINGLGVGSSCDIVSVDNQEYLFVTEREVNGGNDGRGILIVPISVLENASVLENSR